MENTPPENENIYDRIRRKNREAQAAEAKRVEQSKKVLDTLTPNYQGDPLADRMAGRG
jgi:hypothetical protein